MKRKGNTKAVRKEIRIRDRMEGHCEAKEIRKEQENIDCSRRRRKGMKKTKQELEERNKK